MRKLFFLVLISIGFCSYAAQANKNNTIVFAVGHDHQKMLSKDYPMYLAYWEFVNESLALVGYTVSAVELPWARAKMSTQNGTAHGLFLAANLEGRDQWAQLSLPLGYGVFGTFYHVQFPKRDSVVAGVRLGAHDEIFAKYKGKEILDVTTAQQGFRLLFNQKVDRFVMAESYGQYLLNTELIEYKSDIKFDTSLVEKRSVHIAFSNQHPESLKKLNVLNRAISLGFKHDLYYPAMKRNNVPERMWIPAN